MAMPMSILRRVLDSSGHEVNTILSRTDPSPVVLAQSDTAGVQVRPIGQFRTRPGCRYSLWHTCGHELIRERRRRHRSGGIRVNPEPSLADEDVDLRAVAFENLLQSAGRWADSRVAMARGGAATTDARDALAGFYCVFGNARVGMGRVTDFAQLSDLILGQLLRESSDPKIVDAAGIVSTSSFLYAFLDHLEELSESLVPVIHDSGVRFARAWRTVMELSDPWAALALPKPSARESESASATEMVLPAVLQPSGKSLEELLAQLHALIGLSDVKKQILAEIDGQLVNAERRRRGLPAMKPNLHMVFAGNPGTGKTTVARLVGEIYHQAGILSKGHLLEIGPGELLGRWQGENTQRAQAAIEAAVGGVLLIDEAYTLAGQDHGPMEFQQQVIDTLVKGLEDQRADLVVIFTGYTEPMRRFLATNPGLESRVGEWVEFPDYSSTELMEILQSLLTDYQMSLEASSLAGIRSAVESLERNERFGNARLMRNVFEDLVASLDVRLSSADLAALSDIELNHIADSDAEPVILDIETGQANLKRTIRMGFGID